MTREVELGSYLPPYLREYEEETSVLEAENPEFRVLWDAADRVFRNHFIGTADEYGMSRLEQLLGIYPEAADSLEVRRMRVESRWSNTVPYTMRVLIEKINYVLGGGYPFEIRADFEKAYKLQLNIFVADIFAIEEGLDREVKYILSAIVPANMVTEIVHEKDLQGMFFHAAIWHEMEVFEIRQVVT